MNEPIFAHRPLAAGELPELARPEWTAELAAIRERWHTLPEAQQRATMAYLFGLLSVWDRTELGMAPQLLERAVASAEKEIGRA